MSEFFNKKEEVLDIQLTQYGKHLLSTGKFDPKYYAFFDDDIIYDASYAGVTEDQNETQERIFEMPRSKAQYMYYGAETKIHQINRMIRSNFEDYDEAMKIQNTPEKSLIMQYPMGNTDLDKDKAPAWKVRTYGSPVSASAEFTSVNNGYINHITQIDMDYIVRTGVRFDEDFSVNDDPPPRNDFSNLTNDAGTEGLDEGYTGTRYLATTHDETSPAHEIMSEIFDDNSYIQMLEKSFVLLDLEEKNTDYYIKNYEIEVFKIEEKSDGQEVLHPLTFAKKNNMLTGVVETDESIDNHFGISTLTPKNVEWYFDILTDDEIDPSIACGNLNAEQITEMYNNSSFEVDCSKFMPNNAGLASANYGQINPGADEEPCD